jgi:flagellar biosynthetic protein FliP
MRRETISRLAAIAAALASLAAGAPLAAAEDGDVGGDLLRTLTGLDPAGMAAPLRALALITVFSVVPSVILLTTCFPRIVIVLSFLRRALGTQELPPNMVLFGLSLLLTGAIMWPVWSEVHARAYVPLVEEKRVTPEEALKLAEEPLKRFLLAHTLRSDLKLFVEIARGGAASEGSLEPERRLDELSFFIVLPAFVLSELKAAFQVGFLLFLPFVVIDLVVSAVLVSMGMFLLPPALISLPLKVLVFVLVDGWSLVVGQLARSLQGAA